MSDFFNAVYQFVKTVPEGKVVTYGDVARAIGSPRASRQVGWALHCNPYQGIVPCHRVVFKGIRCISCKLSKGAYIWAQVQSPKIGEGELFGGYPP